MRRRVLARCVVIGAALFAISRWLGATPSPPAAARDAAPAGTRDEDALYRAARDRGLDRDDPVVQRRLIGNMRFLGGDADDPAGLYRDAIRVGLPESDLIVRRRLVERMREILEEPALALEPDDAALQAYVAAHRERFRLPARVTLSQVFLSRQRRGAALEADAVRLRERLGPADVARAAALGDALPLPAELRDVSEPDLARLLGRDLAADVMSCEPGRWEGPYASPYGLHLVWVSARTPAADPTLAAVREAVRVAVRDERAAAAVDDAVRALRITGPEAGSVR